MFIREAKWVEIKNIYCANPQEDGVLGIGGGDELVIRANPDDRGWKVIWQGQIKKGDYFTIEGAKFHIEHNLKIHIEELDLLSSNDEIGKYISISSTEITGTGCKVIEERSNYMYFLFYSSTVIET